MAGLSVRPEQSDSGIVLKGLTLGGFFIETNRAVEGNSVKACVVVVRDEASHAECLVSRRRTGLERCVQQAASMWMGASVVQDLDLA